MKAKTKTVYPVKAYVPSLAFRLNAQRAVAAQPATISIGSTGLLYTRSMGGNEGSQW